MTSFQGLHLDPAIAAALAALGWAPEDPRVRDVVPTAARGHNLVMVAPPAPAYGGPALAGVLSRLAAVRAGGGEAARGPEDGGREAAGAGAALLCPAAELEEWSALVHALAGGAGLRVEAARAPARATRRLRAGGLDLLIASPATAALLHGRGALKPDALRSVVLAGPERWDDREPLAALMQDLAAESQRVLLVGDPERTRDLVERYARRALTLGEGPPAEPIGPVRTVAVPWGRRPAAIPGILEVLDPRSLAVWTADRSHHAALATALPAGDRSVGVVTGDAPPAEVIVAFDPPPAERLRQLLAAGEVVLLVPPGTEPYVERLAAPRRPLRLPGLLEAVSDSAAAQRAAIARAIETLPPDRAVLILAPLFERYDPAAVAAALYELWTASGAPGAAPPIPDIPATARVYVGVGRGDGATPDDLVAVLTKEIRVPREQIGRIELRESYALVELPAQDAERIAAALTGTTIRRKRVIARVDRGRAKPGFRK